MRQALIGLGYGDEGKGISTSFLCRNKNPNHCIVVRANGGHQAGHTVVHNGFKHVFSQFGSGTLQGIPTLISKFCTLYPNSFIREYEYIKAYSPIVHVDPMTMITTPWDIDANRSTEEKIRHGSVGMGFGQTIQRNEDHYRLYYQDLLFPAILKQKLKAIVERYYVSLELNKVSQEANFISFIEKCKQFLSLTKIKDWELNSSRFYDVIFEGAQGILLDQEFGFFPNVTRSHTTSKNILELCPNLDQIYYITRTYQTRHGNGFMTNEDKPIPILVNNEDETNKSHKYQGEFRISELDIELLKYAIISDNNYSGNGRHVINKHLIITCNDQYSIDTNKVFEELKPLFSMPTLSKLYKSYGPDQKSII